MSFHSTTSFDRSAGAISASSEIRCSGSATMLSSRTSKCSSIRSMVPRSNRSVLYTAPPARPCSVSRMDSARSNGAVCLSRSNGLKVRFLSASGSRGAFWSTNMTWNSGLRLRSRSGRNSSTSFSNGTSWCAYASRATSRTRPNTSRKLGLPDSSLRSTSVFTNNPINPSSSGTAAPRDRRAQPRHRADRSSDRATSGKPPEAS